MNRHAQEALTAWFGAQPSLRPVDRIAGEQIMSYEYEARKSESDAQEDDRVWWLGAMACVVFSELSAGHVCTHVSTLASALNIDTDACDAFLHRCHWVHAPCDTPSADALYRNHKPLVYHRRRLYLARYAYFERSVLEAMQARLPSGQFNQDTKALRTLLNHLFDGSAQRPDFQKIAVAVACLSPLTLITGGPGTGKTTTLMRLLATLIAEQGQGYRIALAAPTGKAAARMLESIRASKATLKNTANEALISAADIIPDSSYTLHRLLKWRAGVMQHNKSNPLAFDCVVVDEASMIDLAMMHQLLEALSPDTKLILLGDQDQLASVDAGSVLADLCDTGHQHGFSLALKPWLNAVLDDDNASALEPLYQQECAPMARTLAPLRHSYRFDAKQGIGQLAKAINQRQTAQALNAFEQYQDIHAHFRTEPIEKPFEPSLALDAWLAERLAPFRQALSLALSHTEQPDTHARAVFAALKQAQLLCAVREGDAGLYALNQRIERSLQLGGRVWYPGRVVMVLENDPNLSLYNGDIGVVLPKDGELKVAFEQEEQSVRWVATSRLQHVETAFAMTVHKSQGSEFEHVLFVLPDTWQGLLTKELLYTAVTRAKQSFTLLANQSVCERTIETPTERLTGLGEALWNRETQCIQAGVSDG